MKTLILSALMICISATLQAKKTNDVKVLLEGPSYFMPCPQMDMDKNAKNSTVKWRSTEDRHVEGRDGAWVKNVPVRTIKPFNDKKFSLDYEKNDGFAQFTFQLTEEDKYTVLHCYMVMPAASVTNFWLASDETAIVDRETGAHYRAIRCEPAEAWYKYFNFTAPKDSMIDFKIYFPRLLPSTRVVSIYGVPNWHLRGDMEWVIGKDKQDMAIGYDQVPEIHHPTLVRPAHDYSKNNSGTWSVYTDVHLIKPLKEGTKALWLTPEATYVAVAHEQNWLREYMGVEKGGMLLDANGHQSRVVARHRLDASLFPDFGEESVVVRLDRLDASLLKHDLGNPHAVGRRVVAPFKVAFRAEEPRHEEAGQICEDFCGEMFAHGSFSA